MSVCTEGFGNRWTDMVLQYNEACRMSWKLIWGRVPPPSQEESPLEKINTLLSLFLLFLLKLRLLEGGGGLAPKIKEKRKKRKTYFKSFFFN